MGIHDRDYMQAGPGGGPLYRPGRLTWMIIALNGVLWLVYSSSLTSARKALTPSEFESSLFAFISDTFRLVPDAVFAQGKVWQLFTCIWLHDPVSAQHVIFNMLALFFFGRAVEMYLGPKRYLALYLGAGVFASLIYTLWSFLVGNHIPALGASGAVYAVLAWMALQQPRATVYLMMIIPMPMWLAVGVFIIGMELLQLGGDFTGAGSAVAHLSGAAFGAAFWWLLPRFARAGTWRSVPSRPQAPRAQAPSDLEDAHRRTAMRMAMDRLLDKVHNEGIDSLTDEEKAFLERASRELRGR